MTLYPIVRPPVPHDRNLL